MSALNSDRKASALLSINSYFLIKLLMCLNLFQIQNLFKSV
jgi:hypothetical protein